MRRGTLLAVLAVLGLSLLLVPRPAKADTCPVVTQTEETLPIYGSVSVDGADAPVGTIVLVTTPRGNIVGCFEVSYLGSYGLGYIYGERFVSGVGTMPGLRDGESPQFWVNGLSALSAPVVVWVGGGTDETRIDLTATTPPTSTPTNTPSSTPVGMPTPTPLPLAAIGDRVWLDANANGRQDSGEAGAASVAVELWQWNDIDSYEFAMSMTTSITGFYQFVGLQPGDYYVRFVAPPGMSFTLQDATTATDSTDSDADPTTGETGSIILVAGQSIRTLDAGLLSSGTPAPTHTATPTATPTLTPTATPTTTRWQRQFRR